MGLGGKGWQRNSAPTFLRGVGPGVGKTSSATAEAVASSCHPFLPDTVLSGLGQAGAGRSCGREGRREWLVQLTVTAFLAVLSNPIPGEDYSGTRRKRVGSWAGGFLQNPLNSGDRSSRCSTRKVLQWPLSQKYPRSLHSCFPSSPRYLKTALPLGVGMAVVDPGGFRGPALRHKGEEVCEWRMGLEGLVRGQSCCRVHSAFHMGAS